ncbi:hypothetical protein V5799_013102 [Amblyomma americanum]|uniref:Uncharacterized protein n=1 Tax=Amblyomma americanum TaxID=6943 RepID=A0AAQ4E6V6_AMBAM
MPCWRPPERKPFCERLPPEAPPSLSSQIRSTASSSTWDENLYDDVEVPSPKQSTMYVQDKEGLTQISYESTPGHNEVEATTSRDKKRHSTSHGTAPADDRPNQAASYRSPPNPEEHIYEDVDNVQKK